MSASNEASKSDESLYCAECGMARQGESSRCWLCGHNFRVPAAAGRRSRAKAWDLPFQFQLDSLFLTSGLISSCLALARVAPRETLGLLVIVTIAYLRTALRVREWTSFGLRVSPLRKVVWFGTSTAVAVAILAAGLSATIVVTAGGLGVGLLVVWWQKGEQAGILCFVIGMACGVFCGVVATIWAAFRLGPWPMPPMEAWAGNGDCPSEMKSEMEPEKEMEADRSGSEICQRADTLATSESRARDMRGSRLQPGPLDVPTMAEGNIHGN